MGDRVPPDFDLDKDLDQASKDNQPQQIDPGLGARLGGGDQLSGADHRTGDDQPRPHLAQNAAQAGGRFQDALVAARIRRRRAFAGIRECVGHGRVDVGHLI